MSKQLEFEVTEPANLTLAQLIELKLFEGIKLEIIKSISEIAMKEWAIKTTLDSLDADLKIIDFTLSKYKDYKDAFVLRGLEDLMTIFEEYTLKIVSLKQNVFAKVFSERIFKIEKEFRTIVDVLEEWIKTQKSWIYLEPIFS
jgi:dynein heavy chain, axonemal